nr:glycosyltransferase [Candidatus Njordarchaeum guaymaensis]
MTSISVVVVTTGLPNRMNHLTRLLRSLSKQSVKDFELIIAAESRSERLAEIFRSLFCQCERHAMLITGTWNKCRTANMAIKHSSGDVIVLLEDDLVLEERWIEKVIETFSVMPRAGCIYPRCIWVYREGLSSKPGVGSFVARAVRKLSIHESLLRKETKRINDHLTEVSVFTMCVACKREAVYEAGLFDELVEEPIQGEDFDLAFRIRAAGYAIVANNKAIAYHFTRQVTRKSLGFSMGPRSIQGTYRSETYFLTKNWRAIGLWLFPHILYRAIESFAWGVRSRR